MNKILGIVFLVLGPLIFLSSIGSTIRSFMVLANTGFSNAYHWGGFVFNLLMISTAIVLLIMGVNAFSGKK